MPKAYPYSAQTFIAIAIMLRGFTGIDSVNPHIMSLTAGIVIDTYM